MRFDISSLKQLIKRDLTKREFGFFYLKNGRVIPSRKVFFDSEEQLIEFFNKKQPHHAYIGPECNNHDFNDWSGHELVFDIDIDQYDDVRLCGCKGKYDICSECWKLIQTAGWYIRDVVREDFGGKKYRFVFSGRRGIHLWFTDKKFFRMTHEQRQVILDVLRIIKGSGVRFKIFRPPVRKNSFLTSVIQEKFENRLLNYIYKPVLLGNNKKLFKKINISNYYIKKIRDLQNIKDNSVLFNNELKNIIGKLGIDVKNNILIYNAPRIDEPCTIDVNRLMRVPGWVHGDTGNKVEIISDSLEFPGGNEIIG